MRENKYRVMLCSIAGRPEALGSLYVCRFGIGFGVCPKGRTDEKRLFSPNVCDDAGKVLRKNGTKAENILHQKCPSFSCSILTHNRSACASA